jgi:hypothetical protein
MRSGHARKACHTHTQPEIMAGRMPVPVHEPQHIPGTHDITAAAGEVQGSELARSTPRSPLSPSIQPKTPASVPLPSQPRATARPVHAAASQFQHVEPRGLAQPVGGTWASKRSNAISEAHSIKTLKGQQHEMDEQQKRTCMLVVYHTVRVHFFYLM